MTRKTALNYLIPRRHERGKEEQFAGRPWRGHFVVPGRLCFAQRVRNDHTEFLQFREWLAVVSGADYRAPARRQSTAVFETVTRKAASFQIGLASVRTTQRVGASGELHRGLD